MVSQVTIFTVALLGFACTANYGRGYGGVGAERVEDGHGVGAIGEYGVGQNVTIFTVALLGFACTANYGRGYGGVGAERVEDGHGVGAIGEYGVGQNYSPKPYHFHYFSDDGRGNSHYRNEHIDQTGTVRGTYGYRDARGLDRVVEYVADARGFHAKITTNEPGTDDRENPAAVNIVVKKPPAVIQHPCNNAVGAGCNGIGIERVHREEAVMEIDVNKLLSGMKKPIHSTAGKSTVKDYVKDIGSG